MDKKDVLVSIVMPNYNGEKYISETVESVLAQTHGKWELLIIDDCSKDTSLDIIKQYAEKDERIQLIALDKNAGVAHARNIGIEKAQGKYIALLDSDDVWAVDKLERQVALLEESDAQLAYCSYDFIDEKGNSIKKPFKVPPKTSFDDMLGCNVISCSTAMIATEYLKQHLFKEEYYHEDYVLWMELLKLPLKNVGDEKVLMHYRQSTNSRSHKKGNAAKERWKIYRDVLHLPFLKSCGAFVSYAINGVLKYYIVLPKNEDVNKKENGND